MYGWLITNSFLRNEKFDEVPKWLSAAARRKDVELECLGNADVSIVVASEYSYEYAKKPDFIIFWDKDLNLAYSLEKMGFRLFNRAEAIRLCDNKMLTHIALMSKKIAMPKTIAAPLTFDGIGYTRLNFLESVIERLGFPLVVKENFGSFGKEVYLANSKEELLDLIKRLETKPFHFQEFVRSSIGADIRIQVVGGEVVTTMYRHSECGDFRANVTNGAEMEKYYPNSTQRELALRITKELGLDFAGIDFLFGENGDPVLCEVNSNAHFKNIHDSTGVNTADFIIDHVIRETYHK
jgi:RimK family alpha-L-glutamate ligase